MKNGHRPSLPVARNESDWLWVFWFAPAAALLGVAESALSVPRPVKWIGRALAGAFAAWLVVRSVAPRLSTADLWLRVGASAALAAALWSALADPDDDGRRRPMAVAAVVAVGASSIVYLLVGRVAVQSEAAGILAAALGAAALPFSPRAAVLLPRASAGVVALVVV